MNPDFWHRRWQNNEIGFHQKQFNRHMQRFFERLDLAPGQTVFVPLAGKSHDMQWLVEQGYQVLGVELSELAVRAFFQENGYQPTARRQSGFQLWQAGKVSLLCGDFFDLEDSQLQNVAAVYDRASLVALPPSMRGRYVEHLITVLPAASRILLITFEYDNQEMNGPPFSVTEAEVSALYAAHCNIELLYAHDALAENPRFQDKGLSRLHEKVYLLNRRSPDLR